MAGSACTRILMMIVLGTSDIYICNYYPIPWGKCPGIIVKKSVVVQFVGPAKYWLILHVSLNCIKY